MGGNTRVFIGATPEQMGLAKLSPKKHDTFFNKSHRNVRRHLTALMSLTRANVFCSITNPNRLNDDWGEPSLYMSHHCQTDPVWACGMENMQSIIGLMLAHQAGIEFRKQNNTEVTAVDAFMLFGETLVKYAQNCAPSMRPCVEGIYSVLVLLLLLVFFSSLSCLVSSQMLKRLSLALVLLFALYFKYFPLFAILLGCVRIIGRCGNCVALI